MKLKKPTQAMLSSVNAYLLARTHAEVLREKVDSIARDILTGSTYYYEPDEKHLERGCNLRIIKEPKDDWLMSDDDSKEYLTELRQRNNSKTKPREEGKTNDDKHN